ncbi:MAG TPA: 5-formyltetrahydrofolate cyclo-ligase [Candidatus Cybelea sp.]|nr:5-formyltetrahydrofolate cyclo-ligase [Candidatus Cybelea sp.]
MTPEAAAKRRLRTAFRAGRAAIALAASPDAPVLAADNFLAHISMPPGACVAGYWPIGDELDPRPLMLRLAGAGLAIALPVVTARGGALTFRRWLQEDVLEPGVLGIHVPPDTAEVMVPRVLLVPLLAFDGTGHRLGYGGGYYDRTLSALRASGRPVAAVGFAYAGQEQPALPYTAADQRLDWVVTEREARTFK